jgi:hypothetical protein
MNMWSKGIQHPDSKPSQQSTDECPDYDSSHPKQHNYIKGSAWPYLTHGIASLQRRDDVKPTLISCGVLTIISMDNFFLENS